MQTQVTTIGGGEGKYSFDPKGHAARMIGFHGGSRGKALEAAEKWLTSHEGMGSSQKHRATMLAVRDELIKGGSGKGHE